MKEQAIGINSPLSRRSLIELSAALGLEALLGSTKRVLADNRQPQLGLAQTSSDEDLKRAPNKDTFIARGTSSDIKFPFYDNFEIHNSDEQLNMGYLDELLAVLQTNRGTRDSREKAILDNTVTLCEGALGCTTTRLDESGVYITARHGIANYKEFFSSIPDNPSYVFDPQTGRYDQITNAVFSNNFHPTQQEDIAIIYAPSGKPRKPVENIQLSAANLLEDRQLWMTGLLFDPYPALALSAPTEMALSYITITGVVDKDVNYIQEHPMAHITAVRGMNPFGGVSGSSVRDSHGIIVAIESGAYFDEDFDPETFDWTQPYMEGIYKGATVTPLTKILSNPQRTLIRLHLTSD
jgi:hypothetical protein